MEVAIGQKVLLPDPEGEGQVLATVVEFGEPDDAIEVSIEGRRVKRDVVIVQYEEGEQEGFVDRVRYDQFAPAPGS
jgi:hypothetical protein